MSVSKYDTKQGVRNSLIAYMNANQKRMRYLKDVPTYLILDAYVGKCLRDGADKNVDIVAKHRKFMLGEIDEVRGRTKKQRKSKRKQHQQASIEQHTEKTLQGWGYRTSVDG